MLHTDHHSSVREGFVIATQIDWPVVAAYAAIVGFVSGFWAGVLGIVGWLS